MSVSGYKQRLLYMLNYILEKRLNNIGSCMKYCMPTKCEKLIKLVVHDIMYCHFKSNWVINDERKLQLR